MTKKFLFSLLICCVATLCMSAAASELPMASATTGNRWFSRSRIIAKQQRIIKWNVSH